MAQYKTRRQKKQKARSTTIRGILILAVIAGVTIALYFYRAGQQQNQTSQTDTKFATKINLQSPETATIQKDILADEMSMDTPQATIDAKLSATTKVPDTMKTEKIPAANLLDSMRQHATIQKHKNVAIVYTINLEEKQMEETWVRVQAQQRQMNTFANCIQVRRTDDSNVDNAFAMADYLQKKGYVISGRLTVAEHEQGISVSSAANCIVITIGILQ